MSVVKAESGAVFAAAVNGSGKVANPQTRVGWQQFCQDDISAPEVFTLNRYSRLGAANRLRYDTERVQFLHNMPPIVTPKVQEAFDLFDQFFVQAALSRQPVASTGVLLSGVPNSGKSTILTAWLKRVEWAARSQRNIPFPTETEPSRLDNGAEYLPCAYFDAHATLKGFLGHGLNFYDHFSYKNSDVHQLQQALTTHIGACETSVVAIDQLQALQHVNSGSKRVSEAIKYLMDTRPNLFIVGAGISLNQLNILNDGFGEKGTELGQTGSRFIVHNITPYTADSDESIIELLHMLESLETILPLVKKRPGDLKLNMALIMHLTDGRMGAIMQLVKAAAQTAILSGEERITTKILESTPRSMFAEMLTNQ